MTFLDDDEPFGSSPQTTPAGRSPATPRHPRRSPGDRHRQILIRRAVALGAGVLILILLLLGLRSCLDARKARGLESYASNLSDIATESEGLSKELFKRLEQPGNLSELQFRQEIAADRGTAEGHVNRVQGLDTPDELGGAQDELELAFRLRRDALAGIANQIATALGREARAEATKEIAGLMRLFLASDVLLARARTEIEDVLEGEGIQATVPDGQFLPDEKWLTGSEVRSALDAVAGGQARASGGVHGLALVQVAAGGLTLDPSAPATLSGVEEVAVDVQNQGESKESDVVVTFELTGGGTTLDGQVTVPSIAPSEVQTATIPLASPPPPGAELTLEVNVQPVPGEQIEDNNAETYTVIFQ